MALISTLTQLEEVQAAISALTTGAQSYQFGDVRVTKGNLTALYEREKYLKARYNREQRSRGRIRLNLSDGV